MFVTTIPTNRPIQRIDAPDYIYSNMEAKFNAVAQEVISEVRNIEAEYQALMQKEAERKEEFIQEKANLEKLTNKKIQVKVQEIKNPNKDAQLVAESIATAIEKRVAYKRAVQQAIQRAEKAGIKGIKVMVSGRLNGAEIARSEWTLSGRVPLHTLRADVDYATATAHTTYGALGLKVWIFNGEVLSTTKEGENE